MEIVIKSEPKEIADLVLAVQSRQFDYKTLKERLERDFSKEIRQSEKSPFAHL